MGMRQEERGGQRLQEELAVGKGKPGSSQGPCHSMGRLVTSLPHLQKDGCSTARPETWAQGLGDVATLAQWWGHAGDPV